MLRQFIIMALVASVSLAFLFLVFDILANSDDVIEGGMPVLQGIGKYALLRLPQLISLIIPMAAMLAAMSVYNKLHSQHEIGAMQSSGIRILRIIGVFMSGGLFIATLHFIFLNSIVLHSTEELRVWSENKFRAIDSETHPTRYPAWFMVGDYMLFAQGADKENRNLYEIKLIERDPQTGLMRTYTTAQKATYIADVTGSATPTWLLSHGERKTLETGETTAFATLELKIDASPEELAIFDKELDEMNVHELSLLSKASQVNSDRGYYYSTWLNRRFSQPLGTIVMVLIAAPILFMRPRGANRIIAGFAIILFGFFFFVAERIALSFAETGAWPPAFTVWLPTYIFGGGVLLWCLWKESRFSRK